MTTTIDFYLATEPEINACYSLVCKLVDKAYQQKKSIFIYANSAEEAKTLDDLLWTFRDDAFIPHNLYQEGDANIQIGYDVTPKDFNDILLNLTPHSPQFFQQFQRVLEIVPQNAKENSRKKFRFYRDKQCEITTHDLAKTT